jgi:ABC-type nitrate/sulfonate/bicarbonate transport system substrate-binding protein
MDTETVARASHPPNAIYCKHFFPLRWLGFEYHRHCVKNTRWNEPAMSKKEKIIATILALGVVAVLALVLIEKKKDREVRVLFPKIVASLPHFVAEKQGIYKKHHIITKANPVGSSPDMIDAVKADKCDFLPAVSLVDAVNSSLDPDAPLLVIFSHSRMKKDVPFECLLVTPGSTLASLKDLEGHTVGVFPGGTSEASIKWYLKGLGIAVDKIKFQAVPPKEQIDMLLAGKVDAVHAYEPQRTLGVLQYKCRQLSPSIYAAIREPASIGCTAISSRLLKEHPGVARDLIDAWDEAVEYIRTHDREAREILANELSYSREVAQACTWVDVTKSTELDKVSLTSFINVLQSIDPPQIRKGDLPAAAMYGK